MGASSVVFYFTTSSIVLRLLLSPLELYSRTLASFLCLCPSPTQGKQITQSTPFLEESGGLFSMSLFILTPKLQSPWLYLQTQTVRV